MSARTRLSVAVASTLLVAYVFVGSVLGRVMGDSSYTQLAIFNEVVRVVIDSYVEPIDMSRTMAGARLGLTDALDGDSAYLDAAAYAAYKQGARAEGEIGVVVTRRYTFLAVVSARPGSPAEKAGVKAGDIVKTIDGKHTRTISPQVAQRLLSGPIGSSVKLTLLRAGTDPIDVTVARDRLSALAPTSDWVEPGTARIRVPEVSASAAQQVRSQIDAVKKQGAERLVLDLRGSAWGDPAEAVKVAELVTSGSTTVAKLAGRKQEEKVFQSDPARVAWTGPLAVLVDRGTAGGAELVAASVLEGERAPVIGEHTAGRAGVQQTVDLPDGGLVITVATYRTGKGEQLHGKGVKPSVPVNVEREAADEPEGAPKPDAILQKALEELKNPDHSRTEKAA
jgi:carboxyl-terminal processing protease